MMLKYAICFFAIWGLAGDAPVVKNGQTPKGKAKTLVFKSDLRIGGEDEDHLIWSGLDLGLEVNAAGHIFVVDSASHQILEFNQDGKFIKKIGGEGEGPGEFTGLKNLSFLADQTAVALNQVQSSSSFVYFDKDMKFQKVKQLSTSQQVGETKLLISAVLSPNGKQIYAAYLQGPPLGYHVALLDADMKVLQKLKAGDTVPVDPERFGKSQFWVEYLASWFKVVAKPGLMAFHEDGSIYTTQDGKYEITRWNSALKKEMVITRDCKPLPMSEDDLLAYVTPVKEGVLASFPPNLAQMASDRVVREAMAAAEFPPSKNPIFGLVPMKTGELLVVRDYRPSTGESSADIFNAQGEFIGQTKLPPVLVNTGSGFFGQPVKFFFKGDYAYGLEVNEDDAFVAVRYTYHWE